MAMVPTFGGQDMTSSTDQIEVTSSSGDQGDVPYHSKMPRTGKPDQHQTF